MNYSLHLPFRIFFFLVLTIWNLHISAQNTDSLKIVLNTTTNDTVRCHVLYSLIELSPEGEWQKYNAELMTFTEKKLKTETALPIIKIYKRHYALCLGNVGYIKWEEGDASEALVYYNKAFKLLESINAKADVAGILSNMGVAFYDLGKLDDALKAHSQSIDIRKELGDKEGLSISYINIADIYADFGDLNKKVEYLLKSLKILEELGQKDIMASCYNNLGNVYEKQGRVSDAIACFTKAYKIRLELKDVVNISSSLNNLGFVHYHQGNIEKALSYFFESLKLSESRADKNSATNTLINIANVYISQKDFDNAHKFIKKALVLTGQSKNKSCKANALSALGSMYFNKGDFQNALSFHQQSLSIMQEIKNEGGISVSLNNIGSVYYTLKDFEKAADYYQRATGILEKLNDKKNLAHGYLLLSLNYERTKDMNKALAYAEKALKISQEIKYPHDIRDASEVLFKIYKTKGDYKRSLEMHELFLKMNDSLNNELNRKTSFKSQLKYEFDKKAAADSVKVAEEKKIVAVQLEQEKTQRFALYGGLFLVLVFLGFMFNRFKVTQKQKTIIELKEKETQQQKHVIEEKHKEITDSINYAERIQRSFLATTHMLNQHLSDYFIFFKPKDVVSGDFYWASLLNNGHFAFVTADSTGHGVPGAIMSLLNITSLEKAVEHTGNPAEILNATRKTIIGRLKNDGSEEGGKDGMDCSLLAFDFLSPLERGGHRPGDVAAILHVAAANNPVWIVRNKALIEIKPDKMPVGKSDRENESFTLHTIDLQKGDVVYALTDGFPDQFGGPKGKKFMSKNLKELLTANAALPLSTQKELIAKQFSDWVGDLEQVDDVTIIGIRI